MKFSDLVFMEDNPRRISEADFEALAESIRKDPEFFENRPCLVNHTDGKYLVYAGFQRAHAAHHRLGWDDIPCSIQADVPEAVMRERAIRDNTHQGTWNADVLSSWDFEVPELQAFGVPDFVFGEPDNTLDSTKKEAQEDDYEIPDEIKTDIVTGDLFEIGPHRLLCGDSTSADDMGRLMNGEKADLCLTDPPYGLGDTVSEKNNYEAYDDTKQNLLKTISGFFPLASEYSKVVVLTPGNKNHREYAAPSWTMAWFTPAGTGCGPWGFCCWQPILCYGKDPKLAKGFGSHPDAIVHTESSEKNGHPCPKPVKFWSWLMVRTSEENELVYDPFLGSGTTMVAAHQLNRRCYGMEIDPKYCQVIVNRMLKLDPTLEIKRNGQPYSKTG